MSDSKRLSSFTVKEIGEAVKPGLEKMIHGSVKPLESGKITHVTETEITLDGFKIELSNDPFVPSNVRLKWFVIGFVVGLVALPSFATLIDWGINKWRNRNMVISKPILPAKKTSVVKVKRPLPSLPVVPPKNPPIASEAIEDLTDTLSPIGLPMRPPPPSLPPLTEPIPTNEE